MDNNNSSTKLTIITPFKDKNNAKLYQTIDHLYKQNIKLQVRHLIIYDSSCLDFSNIKKLFVNKKNYFIEYIPTTKKGIYRAINYGLKHIGNNVYYIVIGAGDLIFLENIYKIKIEKLLFCKYQLSNNKTQFNRCRNLYSGMPYCHNAIIFKSNNLKYNDKYSISGDYDYFIKFVKKEAVNILDEINYNNDISILYV